LEGPYKNFSNIYKTRYKLPKNSVTEKKKISTLSQCWTKATLSRKETCQQKAT